MSEPLTDEQIDSLIDEALERGDVNTYTAFCGLATEIKRGRARIAKLAEQIQHMGNTAHQAWHCDSPVGWRECERPYCRDALAVLDEDPK